MKIGLISIILMALLGCEEQKDNVTIHTTTAAVAEVTPKSRFTVEYQGAFKAGPIDKAATRSLYIVTDVTTGAQYLALEGCGTAQLVRVGKTIQEQ